MIKHHILTIAANIIFSVMCLGSTITYADEPLLTFNTEPIKSVVFKDQTEIAIHIPNETEVNLIKVYKIGQQFGFGETLQAIMLQESSGVSGQIGNKKANIEKRSYGLMQLQLCVVRTILSEYSDLMEQFFPNRLFSSLKTKELIKLIMKNSEANLTIAAYYLRSYIRQTPNWNYAVAAYNVGIRGVTRIKNLNSFKYVVGVKYKLDNIVKPFNKQYQLM